MAGRSTIFGSLISKSKKSLDSFRDRRKVEAEEDEQLDRVERRESLRSFSQETKQAARDHAREKAYREMNDDNLPLPKKIKAINEYYKDHSKPKLSSSMQELSDLTYINKMRTDIRKERMAAVRQAVADDRRFKAERAAQKQEELMERNNRLHHERESKSILTQQRMRLRRGW